MKNYYPYCKTFSIHLFFIVLLLCLPYQSIYAQGKNETRKDSGVIVHPNVVECNPAIVLEVGMSYKYNLQQGIYTIYFFTREPMTIAFTLDSAELEAIQEKYGLSSKVKIKFAKSLEKSYGATDLSTGDIYIGPGAFQSNSLLKATIVHEYGHSILGRINVNGNWTWRYPQLSYNVTNKTLSFDGPLGYAQEIFNKGRMKINLSAIRNPKLNPLYNIWNLVTPGKYFARRWQFSIPLRFENNAILRLF